MLPRHFSFLILVILLTLSESFGGNVDIEQPYLVSKECVGTHCNTKVGIGDDCTTDIECQTDLGDLSECFQKKCECHRDTVMTASGKCLIPIGGMCKQDNECAGVPQVTSKCDSRRCSCLEGFVGSEKNDDCIKAKKLGDSCEENKQCDHIEYAICEGLPGPGKCDCPTGFVPLSGAGVVEKCYKVADKLGDRCEIEEQCAIKLRGTCNLQNGTCECKPRQVPAFNNASCLDYINQFNYPCEQNNQCEINNTTCIETSETGKTCQCLAGEFVASSKTKNTCVPIVTEINAPCVEHVQCRAAMGELSQCRDNLCMCSMRYEFYKGKCYLPVHLNDICRSSEECYLGATNNSYCTKAPGSDTQLRCRCLPGAIKYEGLCYVPKTVGDNCQNNLECSVPIAGEVVCESSSNICQCKMGYTPELSGNICYSSASLKDTSILVMVAMLISKVLLIK